MIKDKVQNVGKRGGLTFKSIENITSQKIDCVLLDGNIRILTIK